MLAGSSVPWNNKDVVQGTVIKRTGDILTVRGHYINRTDGIAIFNSDIDITVDDATRITAPLSNLTTLDKNSISVGQTVTALGTLNLSGSPYALDSTGPHRKLSRTASICGAYVALVDCITCPIRSSKGP